MTATTKAQGIPAEIQGKWHASGQTPGGPNGERGMSWMAEYTINADGTFVMTGYPQIEVRGNIAVPEHAGARFHVVLTNRKMTNGSPPASDWPDLDGWAELSADGKTLAFDNKSFSRE
jgi:hypothetical protein